MTRLNRRILGYSKMFQTTSGHSGFTFGKLQGDDLDQMFNRVKSKAEFGRIRHDREFLVGAIREEAQFAHRLPMPPWLA